MLKRRKLRRINSVREHESRPPRQHPLHDQGFPDRLPRRSFRREAVCQWVCYLLPTSTCAIRSTVCARKSGFTLDAESPESSFNRSTTCCTRAVVTSRAFTAPNSSRTRFSRYLKLGVFFMCAGSHASTGS